MESHSLLCFISLSLSCSCCIVSPACFGRPFLAILSRLPGTYCPGLALPSQMSCPRCPVLAVLSHLSCTASCLVLAVLSWLSCPGCHILAPVVKSLVELSLSMRFNNVPHQVARLTKRKTGYFCLRDSRKASLAPESFSGVLKKSRVNFGSESESRCSRRC
jgi:hypothetical protein